MLDRKESIDFNQYRDIIARSKYSNIYSDIINVKGISNKLASVIKDDKLSIQPIVLKGQKGYIAYKPVSSTGWTLYSFIPLIDYIEFQKQFIISASIIIIITIITLILLVYLQYKNIIRPIRELERDINAISIDKHMYYTLP